MEVLVKEQRIEAIKEIVKARWINIVLMVALGFVLKTKYAAGNWAPGFEYWIIVAMGLFAFGYNFAYWLFIHRPIEKIGERALAMVAALQVIMDQIMYTLIYYYSGTLEGMSFVLYFITILIASSLYKTKGVILAGLLTVVLHNGLLIVEHYKLIPHIIAYPGTVWFGNPFVFRGRITVFIFYTAIAVAFSTVLANLFKKQIKVLQEQKSQLTVKTQDLTNLAKELGETKTSLEIRIQARTKELQELAQGLEEKVGERTKELQQKIKELESFRRLAVGRELKMAELKKEIEELKKH